MAGSKSKRYGIVAGIIVIVIIVAVALLASGKTEKVMTIAEAASPDARGEQVQVTGNVVDNSFSIEGDVLSFSIYDADSPSDTLRVTYDKGVSATFGNGVTAICSGRIDEEGILRCTELVTKCPSKYETATDALSVSRALGYGDAILDKPVKVAGVLVEGSLGDAAEEVRFILADPSDSSQTLPIVFSGALPESVKGGSSLVLTGSIGSDGRFTATDVAEEA